MCQLCLAMALHCRQQLGHVRERYRCGWMWRPGRISRLFGHQHRRRRTSASTSATQARHEGHNQGHIHNATNRRIQWRSGCQCQRRRKRIHFHWPHHCGHCTSACSLPSRHHLPLQLSWTTHQTLTGLEERPQIIKECRFHNHKHIIATAADDGSSRASATNQKTVPITARYRSQ